MVYFIESLNNTVPMVSGVGCQQPEVFRCRVSGVSKYMTEC